MPFILPAVRPEEEGGEGGGGESCHGAGLRGIPDPPQEGHPEGLRRRRRGRREHPGHRPQVPAGTFTGHVQEVKQNNQTPNQAEPGKLAPSGPGRGIWSQRLWGSHFVVFVVQKELILDLGGWAFTSSY